MAAPRQDGDRRPPAGEQLPSGGPPESSRRSRPSSGPSTGPTSASSTCAGPPSTWFATTASSARPRPARPGSSGRACWPSPTSASTTSSWAAPRCASGASTAPTARATRSGRLSVLDEGGDALVVDWRAPAAEPFYRATGRNPMGLVRRRHLLTRGRTVVDLDDEVFDLDRADADPPRDRGRRGAPGRPRAVPHRADGRHRGHHPGRAGRDHPGRAARHPGRHRRAGHRARPRWPSTGPPTCSTPTASGWRTPGCWWWGRTGRSCATSSTCCPPSARAASSWPRSTPLYGRLRPTAADAPPAEAGEGRRPHGGGAGQGGARPAAAPGPTTSSCPTAPIDCGSAAGRAGPHRRPGAPPPGQPTTPAGRCS